MEFESPDVIKDFPGLYASELHTKGNNESDYSDEVDKVNKTGKKKDKKDRGYAALEGESSPEDFEAKSPSKSKKSKSFKFSSKYKEKREKSREKDGVEKKKEKERKGDRVKEKSKADKKDKKIKPDDDSHDIAEVLPIFGVNIKLAIERGGCHDGIYIPLPVRDCINYLQAIALNTENLYKISGTKSKVALIKKLYNQRKHVDLSEYDIYTVTSLLKAFFRDLPEPILTTEQCPRFDEAAALISHNPREAHLLSLVKKLPAENHLVLSWLITHLHNVTLNERVNKMNIQNLAIATHSAIQTTQRVMVAFLEHCPVLFPSVYLEPYYPPLTVGESLPDDPELIQKELNKQESLLNQIHTEMNAGCVTKEREERLWEVQRNITQLKRGLRNVQKNVTSKLSNDKPLKEKESVDNVISTSVPIKSTFAVEVEHTKQSQNSHKEVSPLPIPKVQPMPQQENESSQKSNFIHEESSQHIHQAPITIEMPKNKSKEFILNWETGDILLLRHKNEILSSLRDSLVEKITIQRQEISLLKEQMQKVNTSIKICPRFNTECGDNLDEIMDLLMKENQILQIKKINLVRNIIEQHESCIEMKAKLAVLSINK